MITLFFPGFYLNIVFTYGWERLMLGHGYSESIS